LSPSDEPYTAHHAHCLLVSILTQPKHCVKVVRLLLCTLRFLSCLLHDRQAGMALFSFAQIDPRAKTSLTTQKKKVDQISHHNCFTGQ
jgi:hypothetical protein